MADTFWSIVTLIGVWGLVACTILLILKAFPSRDGFDKASALRWGGGVVLCFIVWMIGMTRA